MEMPRATTGVGSLKTPWEFVMSKSKSVLENPSAVAAADSDPGEVMEMPARPYAVLYADLPFYRDPECRFEVQGARLMVVRCEDPKQTHRPIECLPTSKRYAAGQTVAWDIDNKKLWETAWYKNPVSGTPERAWAQSVEFAGKIFNQRATPAKS
jgi:hypothetical protein